MSKTQSNTSRVKPYPPLNLPLGQVYVTKEAMESLVASSVGLDNVLEWHATGYGGDCDPDHGSENYDCAERGGPNLSLQDLDVRDDDGEPLQLRIETAPDRTVTIVSMHTEAE